MVRQLLREVNTVNGDEGGIAGGACVLFILAAALITLSLLAAVIFGCAEGASKDKTSSADDSNFYGAGCTAGCGAGCGA